MYKYINKEEAMEALAKVERRREEILREMRALRAMRKGSVMEQYLPVKQRGKPAPVLRGPYWLYTRKEKGRTVGRRLGREEAERVRAEVEAAHRFRDLCREYEELTERLGELERAGDEAREKKRRRSRLRKTGR